MATLSLDNQVKKNDEICWFVGAVVNGNDQVARFIDKGIWKTGYNHKYAEKINSIQVGDKIAIKTLEKEIKQRVNDHLISLNAYYEEDERYSIKLWCGDATQGQLSFSPRFRRSSRYL
jgi:hypothetical protein